MVPVKPDHSRARRHLMKADPALGAIIKRIGPCELPGAAPRDPFEALTRSIASQQLSTKAADTIFGRFCDLFPPARRPSPARVMTLSDDQIRGAGFSQPKVSFIKAQAADARSAAEIGRGLAALPLRGELVSLGEPGLASGHPAIGRQPSAVTANHGPII